VALAPAASAVPVASSKVELKPAVTADPLGDLAKARSAGTSAEPFMYFVQVGAFRTVEDAETQRAKLSLSGVEAKVSEREQSGRAVFRVRVGPFDKKEDADKTKERLDANGLEAALVRVQR
jgi:cell division protein FtsN